jgi:hypothetical protein
MYPIKISFKTLKNCPTKKIMLTRYKYVNGASYSPGGVAQWTSHPPQEQADPGSNPARV